MKINDTFEGLLNNIPCMNDETLKLLISCSEELIISAKSKLNSKSEKKNLPTLENSLPLHNNILDPHHYAEVKKHLESLSYVPDKPYNPDTFLYGDQHYVYNESSKNVEPRPISSSTVITDVLKTVNSKLSTDFNSVLINRYRNKNISLSWHKDDEVVIDNAEPIVTLSIGATRTMMFNSVKSQKNAHSVSLKANSLLVMNSGLQNAYYHQLCTGRSHLPAERGPRYSLTFRTLKEKVVFTTPPSSPVADKSKDNVKSPSLSMVTHEPTETRVDTVVFGSSLTKGLKQELLSKRKHDKVFRVFSHGGARIRTIIGNVKCVRESNELDATAVTQVVLVCGGNDVENTYPDSDLYKILDSYDELISVVEDSFPNASINICSLIPRRTTYIEHRDRMFWLNDSLEKKCKAKNIRFINIFSYFIDRRTGDLLYKLYMKDELHLSDVGSSVLGKVLIGVANKPRS